MAETEPVTLDSAQDQRHQVNDKGGDHDGVAEPAQIFFFEHPVEDEQDEGGAVGEGDEA